MNILWYKLKDFCLAKFLSTHYFFKLCGDSKYFLGQNVGCELFFFDFKAVYKL